MKKRLISMLLTVLMVMSLVTGMSVSAYADEITDGVVEYTLSEGDFVLRLCQRQGINYFTCKDAIMKLNGIKSEAEFSRLAVGRVIKLPATDAAAAAISANGTTTSNSSGAVTTGVVTVAKGNDFVAYYLIPYTMQRGETVAGVCNALGISFNNYADQIMKLNNISSWNKVAAGKTLLLPSTKAPAVGTTCYQIIGHKVASGETAYNMCASYGIDYGSNTKLMQALNNSSNLAKIKAGSVFYMPVVTTIASSSNDSNNSSNSNNNSGSNGNSNSSSNGSTEAKRYNITPNINTAYGTMTFYVDNKAVNTAAAGEKVTVDVVTNNGRAIDGLTVKYANGNADLKLDGATFIMPGCDVRVDAAIKTGYDITVESNYSTKTAVTVSGVSVSSAAQGSIVKIVSTDPGYVVDSATVYYSNFIGKKYEVQVNDAMSFVMPAKDVTVKATLKAVPTYNFYRADCVNGSFDLQVDGFSVSKAAKGANVTIVWEAMPGYTLTGITVTDAKTEKKNISVLNNSFTMPGYDVMVKLSFGSSDNAIVINAVEGGILNAFETDKDKAPTGDSITEASTGTTIAVKAKDGSIQEGYTGDFDLSVTRNADGNRVAVSKNTVTEDLGGGEKKVLYYYTFTMPAGGVTIDGKFIGNSNWTTSVEFPGSTNNENSVTLACGDTRKTIADTSAVKTAQFPVGSSVYLSTLARDGYAFTRFELLVDGVINEELTELANTQGYFIAPNSNITVKAIFTAGSIAIGPAEVEGNGTVSFQVSTEANKEADAYNTANSCKVGDWVKIVAVAKDTGFAATEDNISVTDKVSGRKCQLYKVGNYYVFQMPADGANISVKFAGQKSTITLRTVDVDGKTNLQGQSLWGISVNWAPLVVENKTAEPFSQTQAYARDQVVLYMTDVGKEGYDIDRIELQTKDGKYEGGIEFQGSWYAFYMTDQDVTCTVYMKAKGEKLLSLTNLSYNASRGTVGCQVDGKVVTACKPGDTVTIFAKALDSFYITEDDVSIMRSDYGYFTKSSTPGEGNYQPVYDGSKLVGWNFIMPEGGVSIEVNFRVNESNPLSLSVSDGTNNLLGNGYVQVQFDGQTKSDVSNDLGTAPTGCGVYVSLTPAGQSLYTIEKVTVDGVSTKNNGYVWGFYMPNTSANIVVLLKEKEAEPAVFNIYSSYDTGKGTVSYFIGTESVTQAKKGDTVSINLTAAPGFMLDSYTITRVTDNVVEKEEKELAKDNYSLNYVMPEDSVTVTAKFVNKVFKATVKIIDAAGTEITTENLLQVKSADRSPVNVKSGSTVELTYDTNFNVSTTSASKDMKITGYQIDSADEVKGDRSEFTLKIDKNGFATLTIRLAPKA